MRQQARAYRRDHGAVTGAETGAVCGAGVDSFTLQHAGRRVVKRAEETAAAHRRRWYRRTGDGY